jgi:MtN3 and saliva related transmembrane protein
MPSLFADAVGMAAATLTTLCWLPQAIRILRTRDTRAISLVTQVTFAGGLTLWLTYGVLIGSWPVIVSNILTLVLVGAIIILKSCMGEWGGGFVRGPPNQRWPQSVIGAQCVRWPMAIETSTPPLRLKRCTR